MRRNFVLSSFKINQELICEIRESIKKGKTFIKKKGEFSCREDEFKEKLERLMSAKRKEKIKRRNEQSRELENKEKKEEAKREKYKREKNTR